MKPKVWIALGTQFLVFAVLLFGSSGTLAWPAAWAFLILFFGPLLLITRALARDDPALLDERIKPLIQKGFGTRSWWESMLDGSVGPRCRLGCNGSVPLVSLSPCGFVPTVRANPFLAKVVKIQIERGHEVVTKGPLWLCQHPLYAATLILFSSAALTLGSWFGLAAAILLAGELILRTALEDRRTPPEARRLCGLRATGPPPADSDGLVISGHPHGVAPEGGLSGAKIGQG